MVKRRFGKVAIFVIFMLYFNILSTIGLVHWVETINQFRHGVVWARLSRYFALPCVEAKACEFEAVSTVPTGYEVVLEADLKVLRLWSPGWLNVWPLGITIRALPWAGLEPPEIWKKKHLYFKPTNFLGQSAWLKSNFISIFLKLHKILLEFS